MQSLLPLSPLIISHSFSFLFFCILFSFLFVSLFLLLYLSFYLFYSLFIAISAAAFFDYVTRKAGTDQLRIGLSFYDSLGEGYPYIYLLPSPLSSFPFPFPFFACTLSRYSSHLSFKINTFIEIRYLTEKDLEMYMFDQIPTLPRVASLHKSFYPYYATSSVRKLLFFLDAKNTGKIKIQV